MDCLRPPLAESPPGKWHCPICPPLIPQGMFYEPSQATLQQEAEQPVRESSVASSSRSVPYSTKETGNYHGNGKAFPVGELGMEPQDHSSPITMKSRGKHKSYKKGRNRVVQGDSSDDEQPSSTPQTKRMRLRVRSPAPLPRVRLLPPNKGKGKEREDDEPPKGLFDDVLSVDERDTGKTVIELGDKNRFERSRLAAEVSF